MLSFKRDRSSGTLSLLVRRERLDALLGYPPYLFLEESLGTLPNRMIGSTGLRLGDGLTDERFIEIALTNAIKAHLSTRVQISAGELVVGLDCEVSMKLRYPVLEIRDQCVVESEQKGSTVMRRFLAGQVGCSQDREGRLPAACCSKYGDMTLAGRYKTSRCRPLGVGSATLSRRLLLLSFHDVTPLDAS